MVELLIFKILYWVNIGVMCIIAPFFIQHIFYTLIGLKKNKKYPDASCNHKFAAIISARNEEKVIADIIRSLKEQDYPSELLDVLVVADNCTDNTAAVARSAGAIVYERFNSNQKGKGYALDYLMKTILAEKVGYEAFVFFDADNIADKNFVKEMNKVFDSGIRVAMGYRNTKNFGDNWVAMGNALSFIHESRLTHGARQNLGTSTYVSGTGMMAAAEIFENDGGYKSTTMIEDVELGVNEVLRGKKVVYCASAMIYDEQPRKMRDSFNQRARWLKGQAQCHKKYGKKLLSRLFIFGDYSSYDVFSHLFPLLSISIVWSVIYNFIMLVFGAIVFVRVPYILYFELFSLLVTGIGLFLLLYFLAALLFITEGRNMKATKRQKITAFWTFPFYMFSYVPVVYYTLFKKVEWKAIPHDSKVDIDKLLK